MRRSGSIMVQYFACMYFKKAHDLVRRDVLYIVVELECAGN
jgi:hypothetical protein